MIDDVEDIDYYKWLIENSGSINCFEDGVHQIGGVTYELLTLKEYDSNDLEQRLVICNTDVRFIRYGHKIISYGRYEDDWWNDWEID